MSSLPGAKTSAASAWARTPGLTVWVVCWGVCAGLALGPAGCKRTVKGPPTYTVSGKITKGGEPLPLDEVMARASAASVRLTFYLFDDKDSLISSNSTQAQLDGTFTIGRLPAGRYRVGVEHYSGQPDDLLRGRFGEKSPIHVDVQADVTDLAIELDDYPNRKAR